MTPGTTNGREDKWWDNKQMVGQQTNGGTTNKWWDNNQMVGQQTNGGTTNEQQQDPTLATNTRQWGCSFFFLLSFFYSLSSYTALL
jgi:hypothetical protein